MPSKAGAAKAARRYFFIEFVLFFVFPAQTTLPESRSPPDPFGRRRERRPARLSISRSGADNRFLATKLAPPFWNGAQVISLQRLGLRISHLASPLQSRAALGGENPRTGGRNGVRPVSSSGTVAPRPSVEHRQKKPDGKSRRAFRKKERAARYACIALRRRIATSATSIRPKPSAYSCGSGTAVNAKLSTMILSVVPVASKRIRNCPAATATGLAIV